MLGLNYLHTKCKIIHTDIKPENILVCISQDEIQKLASDAVSASAAGKVSRSLGSVMIFYFNKKLCDGRGSIVVRAYVSRAEGLRFEFDSLP